MNVHTAKELFTTAPGAPYLALPPLILHPFADPSATHKLAESSRANLVIQGLLPAGDSSRQELDSTLLEGRYSEMRMIYYVGKDVMRWIEQSMDGMERQAGVAAAAVRTQSFAGLLIQDTPSAVVDKLKRWGVADYKAIFRRGIGLNMLFSSLPDRTTISNEFIRNYFRYADQLFTSFQTQTPYVQLDPARFQFDLYSSGEYSRMLERAWA